MNKKTIKSDSAFNEAEKYIAGGVNSPVRSFSAIGRAPVFIQKGKGSSLFDVDGNEYIDFCCSWGALILGHAHNKVVDAVIATIRNGTSFGTPTELETELAKMITERIGSIDKVRFVNSGTEAVMSAVRLARAYTGKNKILKFEGCYHGHSDSLLVAGGSGLNNLAQASSQGVPLSFIKDTICIPFNNKEAFIKAMTCYGQEIAAVIVEPVPANMGVILPQSGFLETLRTVTLQNKSLLIFDEVITGFRLCQGGAQDYFNISPDLTCLGKITGGGFPVGAFGGKSEIMEMLAPKGGVYQAGTLSGNPVAVSAGIATLNLLTNSFYQELNSKSALFINALRKKIKNRGIFVNSAGSMFTLFFSKKRPDSYTDVKNCDFKKFAGFYQEQMSKGVYFSPSQFEANFISQAHNSRDLEKIISSF
ncbi:MAG: glutamate-1-semialdehyde 2,1-aminomutase [bacterium]|nr:glutamate-1-semialdehyde 2,1-aminomutase [bacterium]